jgi:hypothetical protein
MTEPDRIDGSEGLLTLEPLVEAVQDGVEHAGWLLSGLQKTTSMEFEGKWTGSTTRSAYLFFHRADLPEAVSLDVFLDETEKGLRGNLALVVDGPDLGQVADVPALLARVAQASLETLPEGYRTPVSLRLGMSDAGSRTEEADLQFRFKLVLPRSAVRAGESAVSALASAAVSAFEHLLERPEIAELLPPVVE